ncbi:MAG: cupin domain-containing protein [Gammaproteobacteria bacterium]|nr:cupin domain-containing protein [Gammaproteobacteria bacterium]
MSQTKKFTQPGKREEYYFKEGCFIEEWLNDARHQELSVARVRVAPRTTTKLHSLIGTTERYVILSGQGNVTVGEASWEISAKDVVIINAGQPQQIANTGEKDLLFLAICTPRFRTENYREL